MSLPVKAGIGLATIGTIGGVGYGIVAYSKEQGTEISKLVEAEYRYILLDTSAGKDENHWTTNWDSYKKANENSDKDFFGLKGWTKNTQSLSNKELKERCEELSKSKIKSTDDKLFERVTKYCGRYVTVKDQAEKNNLKILKTEALGSDDTIWGTRHSKVSTLTQDLKKLGIEQSAPTKDNIREGCQKAATEKTKKETNYQEIYTSYVKVCTRQKDE